MIILGLIWFLYVIGSCIWVFKTHDFIRTKDPFGNKSRNRWVKR